MPIQNNVFYKYIDYQLEIIESLSQVSLNTWRAIT